MSWDYAAIRCPRCKGAASVLKYQAGAQAGEHGEAWCAPCDRVWTFAIPGPPDVVIRDAEDGEVLCVLKGAA